MKDLYSFSSISLLFALFFLFITNPYQLAVTPDAVSYIEVARNFAEGRGIVSNLGELVNHWPPFYAMVLGSVSFLFGQDVLEIGVYFNLFLILIYAFCFFIILKYCKLDKRTKILFLILLLFSIPSTEFLTFLSDGLFATLLIATVVTLLFWKQKGTSFLLVVAGILSGLLLLTRYSAVGCIAGFSLVLLLLSKGSLKNRVIVLLLYLGPISVLFLIWILYTSSFVVAPFDRHVNWHPIAPYKLKFALLVVYDWFIANMYFGFVLLSLILLLVSKLQLKGWGLFLDFRKLKSPILVISGFQILCYLGFIIISISVFDSHTPLDYRVLMPLYALLLISLAFVFKTLLSHQKLRVWAYRLLFVLVTSAVVSSIEPWSNHYNNGVGFTGKAWQHSEVVFYIRKHSNLDLYTNGPDAVRFFSTNPSIFIPRSYKPNEQTANETFKVEIAHMKAEVLSKKKQILYLNAINWRPYLMSKEALLKAFKGFEVVYFNDGFLIK